MKKNIPNLLKVNVPYDIEAYIELRYQRFQHWIVEGYAFPLHDFSEYCAICIMKFGYENLPNSIKDFAFDESVVRPEIKFEVLSFKIDLGEHLDDSEINFYADYLVNRARERKKIIKKEVSRTGINAKNLNLKNSHYRTLLSITKDFNDFTLLDWYIPIVLKFDKFVHIYVKHVEETKFGDGQFKKRSFFDYDYIEILKLLRIIIEQESESIKEHFSSVSIGHLEDDQSSIKDYHRGFSKFSPITYNGDSFILSIDKNGFIQTFFQVK